MSRAVISGSGLIQRFGSHTILGPLDIQLAAEERLAVIGDNGAGKTTLLRILATAARPAAGRLDLFGLPAATQRERLRARLGYAGHQPGLYPDLTALENLRFFAKLHGVGPGRVETALAEVGLAAVAARRVAELSRGTQLRLALARAILHDPELLILDEPDAGLDAEAAALLQRLAAGRTVVIATHDRALARGLCGRSLLLRAGRDGGDPWRLDLLEAAR